MRKERIDAMKEVDSFEMRRFSTYLSSLKTIRVSIESHAEQ